MGDDKHKKKSVFHGIFRGVSQSGESLLMRQGKASEMIRVHTQRPYYRELHIYTMRQVRQVEIGWRSITSAHIVLYNLLFFFPSRTPQI